MKPVKSWREAFLETVRQIFIVFCIVCGVATVIAVLGGVGYIIVIIGLSLPIIVNVGLWIIVFLTVITAANRYDDD